MTVTRGHVPLRRCRACRTQLPKSQLARWVIREGQLLADPTQVLTGRGVYTDTDACAAKLPKMIKGLKR
ncbi:DUF448 domain-containing protein [Candidatus Saccharibacteria bacterium]|nr:DUF448 domain-containing protein [Candidatus Saccharibacteria bacterium]